MPMECGWRWRRTSAGHAFLIYTKAALILFAVRILQLSLTKISTREEYQKILLPTTGFRSSSGSGHPRSGRYVELPPQRALHQPQQVVPCPSRWLKRRVPETVEQLPQRAAIRRIRCEYAVGREYGLLVAFLGIVLNYNGVIMVSLMS